MKKYARKRKSLPSATGDVAGRPAEPSPTDRGGASDEAHADGCGRTEHTLTNDANNAEADVRRRADAAPGVQSVSGSAGRKKLRQLHIDVGQRNFGAIRCRLCGMVYTPGLEEDEALHAKLLCPYSNNNKSSKVHSRCGFDKRRIVDAVHHHSDGRTTAVGTLDPFKRELVWPRLKEERVIAQMSSTGASLIVVSVNDQDSQVLKVRQFASEIERRLGMQAGWLLGHEAGAGAVVTAKGEHPCRQPHRGCHWRVIMCVAKSSRRVQGFLVVENIETAFMTARPAGDGIITYDMQSQVQAELGIRGLWVHQSHRREGIASRMINGARASLVAGYMVPVDRCAFSQPTRDGQQFAEAYVGSREYLVYV